MERPLQLLMIFVYPSCLKLQVHELSSKCLDKYRLYSFCETVDLPGPRSGLAPNKKLQPEGQRICLTVQVGHAWTTEGSCSAFSRFSEQRAAVASMKLHTRLLQQTYYVNSTFNSHIVGMAEGDSSRQVQVGSSYEGVFNYILNV